MDNVLLPIVFVVLISLVLGKLQTRRERRKFSERLELIDQWKKARNERFAWRKHHSYIENPFDSEEYEQLWNVEIGIEAVILIRDPSTSETSWEEYWGEWEKYHTEMED